MDNDNNEKTNRHKRLKVIDDELIIPIGDPSFEGMVQSGFYVDKTDYTYKLFKSTRKFYFIIRPRRFGKSLFLDTIKMVAECRKELFKGCYIYEHDWKKYPVISLDFSEYCMSPGNDLNRNINLSLERTAMKYNVQDQLKLYLNDSCNVYFGRLLGSLIEMDGYENFVIILIDEYDAPFISCEKDDYNKVSTILSSFFRTIKIFQKNCKFIFMTGVTKFHLSGITSGANSIEDLSFEKDYGAMLGFTLSEIKEKFFSNQKLMDFVLKKISENREENYTIKQLEENLKLFYNGYNFTFDEESSVFNPHSILSFLKKCEFDVHWCYTGSPSILTNQFKTNLKIFNIDWNVENFLVKKRELTGLHASFHEIPILPLMYQTGYLTINLEKKNIISEHYYLKMPNKEVKIFLKEIFTDFLNKNQVEFGKEESQNILKALRNENWVIFLNKVSSCCLAKATYRFLDKKEKTFQGILFSFFNGVFHEHPNTSASAERDSGMGRVDIIIEDHIGTLKNLFILELKVDKKASIGMKQIHEKKYSVQYDSFNKKVLMALNFDSKYLNIVESAIEVYERLEFNTFKKVSSLNFRADSKNNFYEITT